MEQKKRELQQRLDAYRQRASEKAIISLLSDATSSSAAESIWLTIYIESKEYSYALKPVPVKLTYTNNLASNKHASVQTERYQPSSLVPMQDMQWRHGSSGTAEGHPTGGPPVRCIIVRSNKAKNAEAALKLSVEGTLRWQQQPTRLSLQGQGWTFHFLYSALDARLRLSDAEYDTEMGEAAILSMHRLTTASTGTKRRKVDDTDETVAALAQFKDQKQAIETSAGSTKRQKTTRTGEPGQADEEENEEEDDSSPQ